MSCECIKGFEFNAWGECWKICDRDAKMTQSSDGMSCECMKGYEFYND